MNRKELIKQYKETPQRMGVFQVKNLTNGKMYIEGSPNLDKIWNRHRTQLVFGSSNFLFWTKSNRMVRRVRITENN